MGLRHIRVVLSGYWLPSRTLQKLQGLTPAWAFLFLVWHGLLVGRACVITGGLTPPRSPGRSGGRGRGGRRSTAGTDQALVVQQRRAEGSLELEVLAPVQGVEVRHSAAAGAVAGDEAVDDAGQQRRVRSAEPVESVVLLPQTIGS